MESHMSRNRVIAGGAVVLAIAFFLVWRMGASKPRSNAKGVAHDTPTRAGAATDSSSTSGPRLDPRTAARASVAGTVRDSSGAPIAGARICAQAYSQWLADVDTREPTCAQSDPDGTYRVSELLASSYSVTVSAARYLPARYERADGATRLWLAAGQDRTGVDFQLRPGGVETTGTVLDIGGGPVAGAWVALAPGSWRSGATSHARSDQRGHFSAWVAPGRLSLTATADGYAEGTAEGTAPGLHLEVLLTPESVLAGTVVEVGSQKPVAGVKVAVGTPSVSFMFNDSAGTGSAITDERGRFRVDRLVPGRYKPTAKGAGVFGEPRESVLLGLGESREDLLIEVHPAFTVTGRIAVGDGDKPCTRGRLELRDPVRDQYHNSGTDERGGVRIEGLLPGTYKVHITCRHHLTQTESPDIELTDSDIVDLLFTVTDGVEIAGTIRDQDGKPVEDAWVRAMVTGGDPRGQRTWGYDTTDASGQFSMKGLVAGTYDLTHGADGFPSAKDPTGVDTTGKTRVEVDLTLQSGGTVVGTVVTQSGQPVPGVKVRARTERWAFRSEVMTRDDGGFRITGIRPGPVRVVASHGFGDELRRPGQSDDDPPGVEVTAVAGQEVSVQLVVEDQSGEISGRIVDAEGAPITDGYVSAHRESDAAGANKANTRRFARWSWYDRKPVLTDPEGRFTVTSLSPGNYTLRGYRRGGGEAFAEGVAVGSQITLTIATPGSISGVVRRDDGQPPAEFSVSVNDRKTGFSRTERFFRLLDGTFTVRDLPAGEFTVAAQAPEGVGKHTVTLEQGQEVTGLEFTLESLVTVVGRMVELDGETPIPGLMVMVQPRDTRGMAGSMRLDGSADQKNVTDAGGRFEVERAPTGPAHIMAIPTEFESSPFGFARVPRMIRGTGTHDVGEIRVPRRRLGLRERAGDLGYTLVQQPPDADIEAQILEVALVRPDGPAGKSGLAAGDIIESIDGHDVTGRQYFSYWTLARAPEGTTVTLGLAGDKSVTITAGPPR